MILQTNDHEYSISSKEFYCEVMNLQHISQMLT